MQTGSHLACCHGKQIIGVKYMLQCVCASAFPYPAAACSSEIYFIQEFSLYIFLHMQRSGHLALYSSSEIPHDTKVCDQIGGLHEEVKRGRVIGVAGQTNRRQPGIDSRISVEHSKSCQRDVIKSLSQMLSIHGTNMLCIQHTIKSA